jgi:hypothetical protein
MDLTAERIEQIIERILWGKSIVDVQDGDGRNHTIILRSCTIREANYAQYIYDNALQEGLDAGLMSHDDLIKQYSELELWTKEHDDRIEALEHGIKLLGVEIKNAQYFTAKKKKIERRRKQAIEELDQMRRDKAKLLAISAENRAEEIKRRYIVFMSTETHEEKPQWQNEQAFLDETDHDFIFNIAVAYYNNNMFDTATLRYIARNGAWRFRWAASKNGTNLFGRSISEWSEMQNMIVYWSQYYDSVYESLDRPSDDIIGDDAACDAWIEEQNKKNKSGNKKTGLKKEYECEEQFIMVGGEEDAKKVQSMNTREVRSRLKKEHEIIKKKGKISEWDLRKKGR